MSYLYGDSTPSSLESNFIQFLSEALEFSVQVLLSAERLKHFAEQIDKLTRDADIEIARLHGLNLNVSSAVERRPQASAESAAASCADAILSSVGEIVERYVTQTRARLAAAIAAVKAEDADERGRCLRALEALVRKHDLPEATVTLHLVREGSGYAATRTMQTSFGLECRMAVEITSPHTFGQVTRIDKLSQLEIHAPESSGWLRKEIKSRPQRLEKHYLSEMIFAPATTTLRLRASLDAGASGFDLEVQEREPRVQAFRIGNPAASPEPLEITEADVTSVLALEEKLRALALEIGQNGSTLTEAKVDQVPFLEIADPSTLVERLVDAMAPVVQKIAQHSLAPSELVLKRLLGDHRREEIFMSKAALDEKLAPLSEPLRRKFRALGLSNRPELPLPEPVESAPTSARSPSEDSVIEELHEVPNETAAGM